MFIDQLTIFTLFTEIYGKPFCFMKLFRLIHQYGLSRKMAMKLTEMWLIMDAKRTLPKNSFFKWRSFLAMIYD